LAQRIQELETPESRVALADLMAQPRVSARAAELLAQTGKAAEPLARARLTHDVAMARLGALKVLELVGDEGDVPAIISLLADSSDAVRQQALGTLRRLKPGFVPAEDPKAWAERLRRDPRAIHRKIEELKEEEKRNRRQP
ncbi:MAG TPA: hypothetical protein VNC50_02395, partial [Planctomycetia bacterium]|nr:hypothetical protein [Planctomycetia bacterium]